MNGIIEGAGYFLCDEFIASDKMSDGISL